MGSALLDDINSFVALFDAVNCTDRRLRRASDRLALQAGYRRRTWPNNVVSVILVKSDITGWLERAHDFTVPQLTKQLKGYAQNLILEDVLRPLRDRKIE